MDSETAQETTFSKKNAETSPKTSKVGKFSRASENVLKPSGGTADVISVVLRQNKEQKTKPCKRAKKKSSLPNDDDGTRKRDTEQAAANIVIEPENSPRTVECTVSLRKVDGQSKNRKHARTNCTNPSDESNVEEKVLNPFRAPSQASRLKDPELEALKAKETEVAKNVEGTGRSHSLTRDVTRKFGDLLSKAWKHIKGTGKKPESAVSEAKISTSLPLEKIMSRNLLDLKQSDLCQYNLQISSLLDNINLLRKKCSAVHGGNLNKIFDTDCQKTISEYISSMVDNVFNEAIGDLKCEKVNRFSRKLEALIGALFKMMEYVEKVRFGLVSILDQCEESNFCQQNPVLKLRLHALRDLVNSSFQLSVNDINSFVEFCFKHKQVVSFFDFFAEELTPQRLLKFCFWKADVCREEYCDNFYSSFTRVGTGCKKYRCSYEPIDIVASITSVSCTLNWQYPSNAAKRFADFPDLKCKVDMWNGEKFVCCVLEDSETIFSGSLVPGRKFQARVVYYNSFGCIAALGRADGKAVFCGPELLDLCSKACDLIGDDEPTEFTYLFRCEPKKYFAQIKDNGNIMTKTKKDFNGQAGSCANGNLEGLFFSGFLVEGNLPNKSPFGDYRFQVPALKILDPKQVNLYFYDFYCFNQLHYATVAVCKKNSEADTFCQTHFIALPLETNRFLRIVDQSTYVHMSDRVRIEIFYTEEVDLTFGTLSKIDPSGFKRKKSAMYGLPHNKECDQCNLHPEIYKSNLKTTLEDVSRCFEEMRQKNSVEIGDSISYAQMLRMIVRLFFGIRNSFVKNKEEDIKSQEPDEVLEGALCLLEDLCNMLLEGLNDRFNEALETSNLKFFCIVAENVYQQLHGYIEKLKRILPEQRSAGENLRFGQTCHQSPGCQ